MDFTGLDYIVFLIFFISILMGLARGLIRELISLSILVVALIITIKFTSGLTYFLYYTKGSYDVIKFIAHYIYTGDVKKYIAFFTLDLSLLLLFLGTLSIGEAVNHYVFPNAFMSATLSLLYRITGTAIGFVRGYAFSVIFLLVLSVSPLILSSAWQNSYFVARLHNPIQKLGEAIQPGGFGNFADAKEYRSDS